MSSDWNPDWVVIYWQLYASCATAEFGEFCATLFWWTMCNNGKNATEFQ